MGNSLKRLLPIFCFGMIHIVRSFVIVFSVVVMNAQIRPPKCAISHVNHQNGTTISSVKPRPNLPFSQKTSSGFATVHYTLTGVNAVPVEDSNNNQIPDYVEAVCEALDYSYKIIVDSLGYPAPIADNLGPDTSLDVYLVETFPLYGATYPDVITSGTHLIAPTYLEIDNDFENNGFYTKGIEGAKVTVAHELHHVIQYAHYGLTPNNTRKIYEMYSTYIESIVYPQIPDYISYVSDLFSNANLFPFGDGNPNSGYHWSIFAIMLSEKYGDGLFKDMWGLIKNGRFPYQALDSALMNRNSNISAEFKAFFPYCFYTNYRATLTQNPTFKNATTIPLLRPFSSADSIYSSPSYMHSGTLKPFELRMVTVQLPKDESKQPPDTFSLISSNFDVESMYNGTNTQQEYFVNIFKGQFLVPTIEDLPYKLMTNLNYEYFLLYGSELKKIDFVFPLPFIRKQHSQLCFPISTNFDKENSVEITILSSDGMKVGAFTKSIVLQNSISQIQLLTSELEQLNPGVYIAVLQQDDNYQQFKVVLR